MKKTFDIYKFYDEAFAIRLVLRGGRFYAQGLHLNGSNPKKPWTYLLLNSSPHHVTWIVYYMKFVLNENIHEDLVYAFAELIAKDKEIEFEEG